MGDHLAGTLLMGALLVLVVVPISQPAHASSVSQSPSEALKIDLYLTSISQVHTESESYLAARLSIDFTLEGNEPPAAIVISRTNMSSVQGGADLLVLQGSTWVKEADDLWKPSLMLNGPFELPGNYAILPVNDVNNWPNEILAGDFGIGFSSESINGTTPHLNITLNSENTNPQNHAYYYMRTLDVENVSFNLPNQPSIPGSIEEMLLSHNGTQVQSFGYLQTLRQWYPFLNASMIVLDAIIWLRFLLWVALPHGSSRWKIRRSRVYSVVSSIYNVLDRLRFSAMEFAVLLVTFLVFIPIFQLSIGTYVPPWVTFVNGMLSSLFLNFFVLLLLKVPLIPLERATRTGLFQR